MKDERLIVRTMERLGIATAYGNRTQAIDYLNRTLPASCGFVAYNPFMPARVGWENYTIYIGGEDDMQKARILEGELTKWFNVRYEQYPRTSGTHIMMNVSVRAKGHLIGAYMGGGGSTEPDALNFTMPNGGTITLTRTGSPTAVTLEYTLDGGATWQTWTESGTTRTLTLNAGEKVFIRNTSTSSTGFSKNLSDYYCFSFDNPTRAGGDVASLLCVDTSLATATNWMFARLFYNQTNLLTAPEISTNYTIAAFYAMFEGCTNMTTPPSRLSGSYISNSACRRMFYNCSSLVRTPEIDATGMSQQGMDFMFYRCSSLASVCELKIQTLSIYGMRQLFYGCSALTEIRTQMTDISASNCLSNWVGGVAASGDFYCPASLTIPTGASGIPSGWTRHDI